MALSGKNQVMYKLLRPNPQRVTLNIAGADDFINDLRKITFIAGINKANSAKQQTETTHSPTYINV